jgi:hypothetical protein
VEVKAAPKGEMVKRILATAAAMAGDDVEDAKDSGKKDTDEVRRSWAGSFGQGERAGAGAGAATITHTLPHTHALPTHL